LKDPLAVISVRKLLHCSQVDLHLARVPLLYLHRRGSARTSTSASSNEGQLKVEVKVAVTIWSRCEKPILRLYHHFHS